MVQNLLAGERGGTNGPFNVTLRDPEMGDVAQKLGAQLRFHTALPPNRLNEMAILMTCALLELAIRMVRAPPQPPSLPASSACRDRRDSARQAPHRHAARDEENHLHNFASVKCCAPNKSATPPSKP